jgi:hypothetical protein
MLKKTIKQFMTAGQIKSDKDIGRLRQVHERLLLQDMEAKGYVPVLDMESQWQIVYQEKKDAYAFTLIMFGVYLGKKKALDYVGFSGQQFIKR